MGAQRCQNAWLSVPNPNSRPPEQRTAPAVATVRGIRAADSRNRQTPADSREVEGGNRTAVVGNSVPGVGTPAGDNQVAVDCRPVVMPRRGIAVDSARRTLPERAVPMADMSSRKASNQGQASCRVVRKSAEKPLWITAPSYSEGCNVEIAHKDWVFRRPDGARAQPTDYVRRVAQLVGRRAALTLPFALAASAALAPSPMASADPGRWSAARADAWYREQGWLVGANFITSTAANQLEMFQPATHDPARIDNELREAAKIGLNTVRVFLHDLLWAQDRAHFQLRLLQLVGLAASHGIKPMFVFFDSCWNPYPKLGPQPEPKAGVHNSGWVQSPGAEHLADPRHRALLRDYVVGVMRMFRNDKRILAWDLWNEPDNPAPQYRKVERKDKIKLVSDLLPEVFDWARSVNAVQPLTSGVWQGTWANPRQRSKIAAYQLENSDIITFHSYGTPSQFEARIRELTPLGRPVLCTEYMARSKGSTIEGILPIAKRHNVGAYNWGLVAGRTQTYLPWDSWDHPYAAPPRVWFHDLIRPDGRAYLDTEVQTIRKLIAKV